MSPGGGGLFADMLEDATRVLLADGGAADDADDHDAAGQYSADEREYKMNNGLKTKGQWTREEDEQLMR